MTKSELTIIPERTSLQLSTVTGRLLLRQFSGSQFFIERKQDTSVRLLPLLFFINSYFSSNKKVAQNLPQSTFNFSLISSINGLILNPL